MANICDNELKLIAYNDEAITVINEIRNKIKEKSEESFYSYLCPDSKLWGTDERDFKFVNVSILHSSEKEIHLHLATRWSPPVGAVEEFQTRMDDKEIDLSISLTYIEPGCDFIGFYLDGDSDEMSLVDLYKRLVDGNDDKAKVFAKKVDVDIESLAEGYMCLKAMYGDEEEPCTCALCLSTAQNTPNQI